MNAPNTAPFARLAKKLELPPTATREDIAGALLDATAKMRTDLDAATRKAVGAKTLMLAYESNTQEPRELARVLDTLSGVQTFQEVAHALVAAVAGLRNYRKALAASSFDKRETVLADMDLALALLSREGLLAVPSASSSPAPTTTTAAPKTTVDEYRGLGRELYAQAVAQGVDLDRLVAVRAAMNGEKVPEAALRPSKLPKASAPPSNLSADTVEKARRAGVDPNRVADTLRAILRRGES